jgi:hypothetical protein
MVLTGNNKEETSMLHKSPKKAQRRGLAEAYLWGSLVALILLIFLLGAPALLERYVALLSGPSNIAAQSGARDGTSGRSDQSR